MKRKLFALVCFAVLLWPHPSFAADPTPLTTAGLVPTALHWFSAGQGGRVAAAGLLWVCVLLLERVPAVGAWVNARPVLKRVTAVLLAVLPGAAAALWAGVPFANVAQTTIEAFLGATGLNVLLPSSPGGTSRMTRSATEGPLAAAVLVLMLGAATPTQGCAAFPAVLADIVKGVSFLSGAIDAADTAQKAWFGTSPDAATQDKVAQALTDARDAAALLAAVTDTVKDAQSQELAQAKGDAIASYQRLYQLLVDVGAVPRPAAPGAAKLTSAPKVPTPADCAEHLGGTR